MLNYFYIFIDFILLHVIALLDTIWQLFRKKIVFPEYKTISEKKVGLITGGTSGLGLAVARKLVKAGYHIFIVGRENEKNRKIIESVKHESENGDTVEFLPADLADLQSVNLAASAFLSKDLPLHLLINNAGVLLSPLRMTSAGCEEQFTVNYLSHVLLTDLLLKRLSASGTAKQQTRIVNLTSVAHLIGRTDFENCTKSSFYSPYTSYCRSKLAIVMWTYHLQKQLIQNGANVTVSCVHPGMVNTELYRNGWAPVVKLRKVFAELFFKTSEQAADTVLFAAVSDSLEGQGGLYIADGHVAHSSRISYNEKEQENLWRFTMDKIKLFSSSSY